MRSEALRGRCGFLPYVKATPGHEPTAAIAALTNLQCTQGGVARRAFVTPNWLPVILVVVGVIVLAMLAYSILGWTGMR